MTDKARSFNGTTDLIAITNPVGIDPNAIFTMFGYMKVHSFGLSGRVAARIGTPAGDTGIAFGVRETGGGNPQVLRTRTNGSNNDGVTSLVADVYYIVGITHDGSGNEWFSQWLNGVEESIARQTLASLSAGQKFQLADSEANTFREPLDGSLAWIAWLQGVKLSGANQLIYANNPLLLVSDYGPTGAITANALKIFWPCQCDNSTEEDVSGVGNDGTYTGTTLSASGPSPTTPWDPCSAPVTPPTPGFTTSVSIKTVTVTNTAVAGTNPITSNTYDYDHGGANSSPGDASLTHTYPLAQAGTHTIRQTVVASDTTVTVDHDITTKTRRIVTIQTAGGYGVSGTIDTTDT